MKNPIKPVYNFSLITLLGILFTILALLVIALFLLQFTFPGSKSTINTQARITVIPAASPTTVLSSSIPGAPTPTPTPVAAGMMGIGAFVQISGTGGDGLRLRNGAGTDFSPVFLGSENEVFKVVEGPTQADGYVWWFLVAPYDDLRKGWAVESYLTVITILTPTPKSN